MFDTSFPLSNRWLYDLQALFLTRFGHITVLLYKVYLKLFLKIVVLVDYLKTKLNKETETFGRIYKKA